MSASIKDTSKPFEEFVVIDEYVISSLKAHSHKTRMATDSAVNSCGLQENRKYPISSWTQSTAESVAFWI